MFSECLINIQSRGFCIKVLGLEENDEMRANIRGSVLTQHIALVDIRDLSVPTVFLRLCPEFGLELNKSCVVRAQISVRSYDTCIFYRV